MRHAGAGIFYDWQGWRYVVPWFCLADPDNLVVSVGDSPWLHTALVDDFGDDTSVVLKLWDERVLRVAAGQSVGQLRARFGGNIIVLRLGKVLDESDVLQKDCLYQIFSKMPKAKPLETK